jgi:hypothetical protein
MTTETKQDDGLAYWCQACRETGMIHCAHPDECGGMLRIPRPEAQVKYDALRAARAATSS